MRTRRLAWIGIIAAAGAAGCSNSTTGPRSPQHQVTASAELLTSDGRLREPGWSPAQLQHWDVTRVHDPSRLRQWDFFTIMNDAAAVNLTLTDLGFAQLGTVGVVDFTTGAAHNTSLFKASGDQLTLSGAVEGSSALTPLGAATPALSLTTTADTSSAAIAIPSSLLGAAASGTLTMHRRPAMPYLSLATPFDDDPHFFFYEQKIPGLAAEGMVTLGAQSWSFDAGSAIAVMDWGRGEWPSTVTWRWAGGSGSVDGITLSFNLGEGFGNATAGTENLVVSGDVPSKFAEVDWTHDAKDPLRDWTFHSRDGRLSLVLHPIGKETGGLDLGVKYQHVFKGYGRYSGTIVLDDGRTVTLGGLLGFAEEVNLAW